MKLYVLSPLCRSSGGNHGDVFFNLFFFLYSALHFITYHYVSLNTYILMLKQEDVYMYIYEEGNT